jgi:hypothetical protein
LLEVPGVARIDSPIVNDPTFRVRESILLDHRALHVVRQAHEVVYPFGMKGTKPRDDAAIHMTDDDERRWKSWRNALKNRVVVVDESFNAMFSNVLQESQSTAMRVLVLVGRDMNETVPFQE